MSFSNSTPNNSADAELSSDLSLKPEQDTLDFPPQDQTATIRKATLRLVPFLFFLYVIAYLDRVNVSFAKKELMTSLHFTNPNYSDHVYALGAGIFFIGYFLFEIPSNLLLKRFGAKVWLARIMFTWGIISSLMLFIHDEPTFYALRFLLGVAEAGFFPGVILYLTFWFTRAERGRIVAQFMTANMVAYILGSPISSALMKMHGGGLEGWQWLFLLEGIPAILIAFVVYAYLPNGPLDAKWLAPDAKRWLTERLQKEDRVHADHSMTLFQTLRDPRVLHMCLLYLSLVIGMYGFSLWLPTLIKDFGGVYKEQAGWITTLPYLVTIFGMVLIGIHSDLKRERRLHVAGSALLGVAGLLGAALLVGSPIPCLICLAIAAIGMWGSLGPFWGLSTHFLAGTAAAGAIAMINSIGNLGGFFGPVLVGWLDPSQNGYRPGLLFLATSMFIASLLALATRKESSPTVVP